MKKIVLFLILILFVTGCEGGMVKPLKDASIEDGEYNDIVVEYINDVASKVKDGTISIENNYLYFIPVGSDNSSLCTSNVYDLPYSGNFVYAYVGVLSKGTNKQFFFVSKDSMGYGYNFNTIKQIEKTKGAYVYSGDMLTTYSTLENYYNSSGSGFAEVPYSDLNVNNSLTTVLGKDLDIARIFYYNVCNN